MSILSTLFPCFCLKSRIAETHNSSDSGTVPLTDLSRTPTGQSGLPHTIQAENDLSGKSYLLPPASPEDYNRKCLVLDLDETLLHSSFKVLIAWIR